MKGGRPKALQPNEILKMIEDRRFMSFKQLGAKYGCSKSTAYNYCKRSLYYTEIKILNDIETNSMKFTSEDTETFPELRYFQDDSSQTVIGKRRHTQDFTAV